MLELYNMQIKPQICFKKKKLSYTIWLYMPPGPSQGTLSGTARVQ